MPTTSPILGWPLPSASDAPDGPTQIAALAGAAEKYSNMRFASTAARDAAIPAPVAGMVCFIGATDAQLQFIHDGAGWVAAVATGSSANGSYIRFANGVQQCWISMDVTDQTLPDAYGSLYTGTRAWTFPLGFLAPPVVTCSQFSNASGWGWGAVAGASATVGTLRGFDVVARVAGTSVKISATALGRWR